MNDFENQFKKAAGSAIYIETNYDIASVIDLVKQQSQSLVVLVLPKRGDVFKNTVNLKLLKTVSASINKEIVLISNDQLIVGLAGRLKIATSPNLKQAPKALDKESPEKPKTTPAPIKIVAPEVKSKPASPNPASPFEGRVEPSDSKRALRQQKKESKKQEREQRQATRLGETTSFFGRLASLASWPRWLATFSLFGVPLIILTILTLFWWPETNFIVRIETQSQREAVTVEAEIRNDIEKVAVSLAGKNQLPLAVYEKVVNYDEKIEATGRRILGDYATGTILVTNCENNALRVLPGAFFEFQASNGTTYSYVSLETSEKRLAANSGSDCQATGDSATQVSVRAGQFGAEYNRSSGQSFKIRNISQDYRAVGGIISGGSSQEIIVVREDDITRAKAAIEDRQNPDKIKQELIQQAKSSFSKPIETSFIVNPSEFSTTTNIGEEPTDQSLISQTVSYRLGAVNFIEVEQLILAQVQKNLGPATEVVKSGLDSPRTNWNFEEIGQAGNTPDDSSQTASSPISGWGGAKYNLILQTTETLVGRQLQAEDVFARISGQNVKEAAAALRQDDLIEQVNIETSPFWASQIPRDRSQVEIIINEQPSQQPQGS